jgi:HK97 gp10 family phage protein
MNLQVSVTGTDALTLRFKYLIKAAQQGLKFGVSEGADLIAEEAKTLVPVLTGNLRDHIHTETVIDQPERQVMAVTPVVESSNEYGFDPAYARRIELGFMGTDKLGRTYHQAAQPYMRPAFDAKKADAETAIKDGVLEALFDAANQTAARRRG